MFSFDCVNDTRERTRQKLHGTRAKKRLKRVATLQRLVSSTVLMIGN